MKMPRYLVAGLVFLGTAANAQTLDEALITAYTNNPTLLAERARLRATDEQVPQALSGWRPVVRASADAGKSRVDSNTAVVNNPQTRSPRTIALQVSQPIYDGGRTPSAIDQAENTVKATRAQLTATEQGVLLSTATAYHNVLRDQAILDLNVNNVQVLRRQLEAAQDRFRVGEITRTDVSQSEARLARAIADRVSAEGNLQASRAAFQNVVGIVPGRLVPAAVVGGLPRSLPEATELAASQNPGVVATSSWPRPRRTGSRGARRVVAGRLGQRQRQPQRRRRHNRIAGRGGAGHPQSHRPAISRGAVYSRVRQQKHTANQRRIEVNQERRNAIENAAAPGSHYRPLRRASPLSSPRYRPPKSPLRAFSAKRRSVHAPCSTCWTQSRNCWTAASTLWSLNVTRLLPHFSSRARSDG